MRSRCHFDFSLCHAEQREASPFIAQDKLREKSCKISQSRVLPGREAPLSRINAFGQAFEMTEKGAALVMLVSRTF